MSDKTYLFGPFIGELSWEMFRFAPYAIYLRRREAARIVVFTRPERFDLYGKYANILVPLSLPEGKDGDCFSYGGITYYDYKIFGDIFYSKYSKKFDIKSHFYPEIREFRARLKWQFPRYKMDYVFKPRVENDQIMNGLVDEKNIFIDLSWIISEDERLTILKELKQSINSNSIVVHGLSQKDGMDILFLDDFLLHENCSSLGYIISSLRKSSVCIGNLHSTISHLAILLGIPLISISGNQISEDEIGLLNPLKTRILNVDLNCLDSIQNIIGEIH